MQVREVSVYVERLDEGCRGAVAVAVRGEREEEEDEGEEDGGEHGGAGMQDRSMSLLSLSTSASHGQQCQVSGGVLYDDKWNEVHCTALLQAGT
jgi:hypothetical protein